MIRSCELEVEDRVAHLTLNRPDRRNAFDTELANSVLIHLDNLRRSDAEVLVLRGHGEDFCAGGDLGEMLELGRRGADAYRDYFETLFAIPDTLVELPQIVVACVKGVAAGFGLALVLSSDIAVAARSARLGAPELSLGLRPTGVAAAVTRWLPPAVGRSWLLQPYLRSAREARDVGAISMVVDDDEFDREFERVLGRLLEPLPGLMQSTKAFYRQVEKAPRDGIAALAATAAAESLSDARTRERLERFVARSGR